MGTMTTYDHGQFSWVDLMSTNTENAKKFYGRLFGWAADDKPTDIGPAYTIFKLEEAEICGMGPLPPDMQEQGVGPMWNSYLNVDNLDAAIEKAESLGGHVFMPKMQVMDAGSMAGITDPSGGAVFLWQKDKHAGADRVNDPGCFCWNELATRDIEAARVFFAALLDWEFEENPHSPSKYYIVKNNGRENGGLIEMDDKWDPKMPAHWSVYFTVEDADAAVAQVEKLGGTVCAPPFEIPIGRIAIVADPEGATFCFFEFGEGTEQP